MVVDEELATMVDNNCCYFYLMIDESTHIVTTQMLIIYIHVVNKGEIITQFLDSSTTWLGGTADHILHRYIP